MKCLLVLLILIQPAFALDTGDLAPDFSITGLKKTVNLSQLRGKVVVLEWLNHNCPFVRKHYDSGNMQRLQKKFTTLGVQWFSIISSGPGKQGYVDKKGALADLVKNQSLATDILLDPTGKTGRLYDAKTTPHIFVLDPKGKLIYQGAIDDKPDTDKNSIAGSKNYLEIALEEFLSGKSVTQGSTKAYGCSIKYK
jgi:peroxiredoxin